MPTNTSTDFTAESNTIEQPDNSAFELSNIATIAATNLTTNNTNVWLPFKAA